MARNNRTVDSDGATVQLKKREPTDTCNASIHRKGKYCQRPAGWGTDHAGAGRCKWHGGANPNGKKAAAKHSARQAVETYGLPREIDPATALLEELYRTAGHVSWLELKVRELDELELVGPVGQEGVDAKTSVTHHAESKQSIWISMYQAERKHLADISTACLKAGIEERRVQLAEQQGQLIADVIRGVLSDLGLSDDKRVPAVVRKHLSAAIPEKVAA